MKSSEIKYATIFISIIFIILTVFIISTNNKNKYINEKEKELSKYSYKVEKCYDKGLKDSRKILELYPELSNDDEICSRMIELEKLKNPVFGTNKLEEQIAILQLKNK